MSCNYLPNKLNILVKKITWFNKISRNKLILFLLISIILLDTFFSKEVLYIGLKFLFLIIFLSFGRDDFLESLSENKNSNVQSSLYCFSMYFTILMGVLFIVIS